MTASKRDVVLFPGTEVPASIQHKFVEEWRNVEEVLNKLEAYEGVLFVPTYMGLRNSGRHFLEAISKLAAGERADVQIALSRAVDELTRARHDALRSLINYCHYKLLLIEEQYDTDRIFQVCPSYFDLREEIEAVNTRLNEDFKDAKEADTYFVKLESDYLPELLVVFDRMMKAKNAALDGIKKKDQREERYKKLALIGFGVGILGLAVAVAAFFI